MKKISFLLILFICLFASCKMDVFLPNPNISIDKEDSVPSDTEWHAPKELRATQGKKRVITLTWKPVSDAVRYNIYRADNEFSEFSQVGETKDRKTEFEIKVEPGYDKFYCVTAVDMAGNESNFSNIERATTLAKPIINNIEGSPEAADSEIYVSWYMNNIDAYSDSVFYKVVCYDDKNKEIARQQARGYDTRVKFTGLKPNTNYLFQVEAFNYDEEFEVSEILDAETARRLRPDPASNLVAEQGLSTTGIKLSFILPDHVEIRDEDKNYISTPIYFKIFRREYKGAENKEPWKLIKPDFGVNKVENTGVNKDTVPYIIDYAKVNFGSKTEGTEDYEKDAEEYTPGKLVTYEDKYVERGVKYEYKVQSFAYTKTDISSNESIAVTKEPGWLLPESVFKIKDFKYEIDPQENKKTGVVIDFDFSLNDFGINYKYKIIEEKRDLVINDPPTNSETKDLIIKDNSAIVSSIKDINDFVHNILIESDNEGYYKYSVSILSPDGTVSLETNSAEGEILVTTQTIPEIGDITVTSGYSDRIKLEWDWTENIEYSLNYWDSDSQKVEPTIIDNKTLQQSKKTIQNKDKIVYEDGAKPGIKRIYQLVLKTVVPQDSQTPALEVPSKIMEGTIPTGPMLISNFAYDKISVEVQNVNVGNKYTVSATFVDDSLNSNYKLQPSPDYTNGITPDDSSIPLIFDYTIVKNDNILGKNATPIDASIAGNKVTVSVSEEHPLEKIIYHNSNSASGFSESTNAAVEKLKSEIETAYVGPALLNLTASQGTNADNITVTWDEVLGADAYVVFRDRYHLGRSGNKEDLELQNSMSDKYIVTLNENGSVTVKCDDAELEASELGNYVSAKYDAENKKFTLTDKYREKTDTDAGNQWRTGQAEITWGAPNEYTVMPVLSVADGDNSSKDNKTVSIDKIKIEKVPNVRGGTKGFGWNVTATQGTYASSSSVDSSGNKINDAIEIKWTEPYFGNKDEYAIFRKEAFTEKPWEKKFISDKNVTSYVDNSIEQGKIYDYAIVDVNYGNSLPDVNFIKSQKLGEKGSEIKDSLGFILPKPKISKVSRNDLGVGNEEVKFFVDPEINDMINGYIIQVRNNNIDDKWHDIKTVPITPDNKDLTIFSEMVNNDNGLLKVLRDYKHYYRILAYTEVGGQKVYSKPDETEFKNDTETDYVKWGCRQISNAEFARAAIIGMSTGMEKERDTRGSGHDGKGITGLKSTSKLTGNLDYKITFSYDNYDAKHTSKAKVDVSSVLIKGTLYARGGSLGVYQTHYWTDEPISVTYNGLIGTLLFKGDTGKDSNSVSRYGGVISVSWNEETKDYDMGKPADKKSIGALPFAYYGEGYLNSSSEWDWQ